MDSMLFEFMSAYRQQDGLRLAEVFTPVTAAGTQDSLRAFYNSVNAVTIESDLRSALLYRSDTGLTQDEANAWKGFVVAYWNAAGELVQADDLQLSGKEVDWSKVLGAWRKVADIMVREFQSSKFPYWAVPLLPMALKYMRNLAIKADDQVKRKEASGGGFSDNLEDDLVVSAKNANMQEAARMGNRMFAACLSDRSPIEESRKWGIYAVTNMLFRIYFHLNALNLAKSLINSIASQPDIPSLDQFPKSHQVTFNYYIGVITFLAEDYVNAEQYFHAAWRKCHPAAKKNQELILTYLIPCHLLTSKKLPTNAILGPFPRLSAQFQPILNAIKRASLRDFDAALRAAEPFLVRRRIYLTIERTRDLVIRNVFRKVFLAGGYEDGKRRTRVPCQELDAGIKISEGRAIESDEVECLVANMIYKEYMKGYIAQGARKLVLSKGDPFPGTIIPA